jgi:hypothetical protein
MMFAPTQNRIEDDSVSLSIASDTYSEKLETPFDSSLGSDVRRSDVLCGRGKTSFNHGKWLSDRWPSTVFRCSYIKMVNNLSLC